MSRPRGKESKRRDGVVRVDANVLGGTATVVYDETRVAPDEINILSRIAATIVAVGLRI